MVNEDTRERPVETSLFWLSSRYYSPELCRFISPDDIEYLDPESVNGLNLYCYCSNNPISYCNPSGYSVILAMLIGVGIGAKVGVGVGQASNTSDKLGITGWEKFWYSVSGIFVYIPNSSMTSLPSRYESILYARRFQLEKPLL